MSKTTRKFGEPLYVMHGEPNPLGVGQLVRVILNSKYGTHNLGLHLNPVDAVSPKYAGWRKDLRNVGTDGR